MPHIQMAQAGRGYIQTPRPQVVGAFRLGGRARGVEGRSRFGLDALLLRQWLAALLDQYVYLTVQVMMEDGTSTAHAFQLLDLERQSVIVRPFLDAAEEAELQGIYTVRVQPLEIWRRPDNLQGVSSLETFVIAEPTKVDLVAALGGANQGLIVTRHTIRVWQAKLSDVEGCTELHSPEVLARRPQDLMSPAVSPLTLLDALRERGFAPVDGPVEHKPGIAIFDRRRAPWRRVYFQCVLHSDAIFARGIGEFPSVGPNAFFEALLKGKSVVRPGLPASHYKKVLARERGEEHVLDELELDEGPGLAAPLPARALVGSRPDGPPPLADGAEESDDGSIVGGILPEVVDEPVAPAVADLMPDDIVGGEVGPVAEAPTPGLGRPGVPSEILGAKISFVPGRDTATHTYADRIGVRCPNPAHGQCGRTRSLELMRDRLGPRCAEAFIGAWLGKAYDVPREKHRTYTPTLTDMEKYLASYP